MRAGISLKLKYRLCMMVHFVQSFMVVLRYLHKCDCDFHNLLVGIM